MTDSANGTHSYDALISALDFGPGGLVCAIAQQYDTGEVLMVAWMNEAAIRETLETGRVCYWSRSRQALWRKGESSGQTQQLKGLRIDCDGDAILLLVNQAGVACHTGRRSCFYREATDDGLKSILPVVTDPKILYG